MERTVMKLLRPRKERDPAHGRGRWRARAFLAASLSILAAVPAVAGVTAAHADTWHSNGILRSWTQGQCLDSSGAVYENPCWAGDRYQQWNFLPLWSQGGAELYVVQDVATGQCLDSPGGGNLDTINCTDNITANTEWYITEYTDGFGHDVMHLQPNNGNGCLDANLPTGGPYLRSPCYSGGYQDWSPAY
jgi:hypothetical protein